MGFAMTYSGLQGFTNPQNKTISCLLKMYKLRGTGEIRRPGLFCVSTDLTSFCLVLHQSLTLEVIDLPGFLDIFSSHFEILVYLSM